MEDDKVSIPPSPTPSESAPPTKKKRFCFYYEHDSEMELSDDDLEDIPSTDDEKDEPKPNIPFTKTNEKERLNESSTKHNSIRERVPVW